MSEEKMTNNTGATQALENLRMRLLDLTARNRLINFKQSKTASLRVIDELPNQLVDTLLAEKEMRFVAVPEPTEKELIAAGYLKLDEESGEIKRLRNDPSAEEWARHLGFATNYEVPLPDEEATADKHADTSIQTLLYPFEMEARLKGLLQASESAIEEMGANILYLAFGFLEWFESSDSDAARHAPLFLMPVRLHKGRLNPETRTYTYTLSYSGEDIIPNLSLREKLRIDFGLALPDLNEDTEPEAYFQDVQALIDNNKQDRWRVRRFISLALLNFSKLLMYLDLDPARWPDDESILEHPVVSRFLSGAVEGGDEPSDDPIGFGEEYLIDEIDDIHAHYPLIDDADSSQHSALIDAINGKNLVIEGPPGTGKSQTITNLIAAAMARGKKVLFVAEKLAALEVVRSRLDAAGLGDFCLELHSHKTQKRRVLDELDVRLKKRGKFRSPKEIDVDIARFEELKTELKNHAERINTPWKRTGRSAHEIFVGATRYRSEVGAHPESLHPKGYDGDACTPTAQRANEDQVAAYQEVHKAVAEQLGADTPLQTHPWFGVRNGDLQFFDVDRVVAGLETWQTDLNALRQKREALSHTIGCSADAISQSLEELRVMHSELAGLPVPAGNELLDRLPVLRGDALKAAKAYQLLFESIQKQCDALAKQVGPEVLEDLSQVTSFLDGSARLKKLVGNDVELGRLAEALNRLAALLDQFAQLAEPFAGVSAALGSVVTQNLTPSEAGLRAFGTIVGFIASLNPAHWKLRNDALDNDALDNLLPRLRDDLAELCTLRDSLTGVFAVEKLPDEATLRDLGSRLDAGGLFGWFKRDWREAKAALRDYAARPTVKLPQLREHLDKAAAFARDFAKLEHASGYREALDDLWHGLDTDASALIEVRGWYKRVRSEYGVGFGAQVAVGDAVLAFDSNLGKAIRSLAERGIQRQLDDLLDDLMSLREVFSPVSELRAADRLLVGDGGVLANLKAEVESAIKACGSIVSDDTISMSDVAERIEALAYLKRDIEKWNKADLDNRLFGGRLALSAGPGKDNTASLDSLRNTLKVAAQIESHLQHDALGAFIHANPTFESFETLAIHASTLHTALEAETRSRAAFGELVRLDEPAWLNQSGDNLDALASRNLRALDAPEMLPNWLDYVRIREQLESLGLQTIADAVEQAGIGIDQAGVAYKAGVFDLLAREILREDPKLARFSGHTQEALQTQFKQYDNKLKKLQCEQIAWKIDQAKVPSGTQAARASELTDLALLERECTKKKRHVPLRQLLQRAGTALAALKPCFMMGPMSVAQYLAPGKVKFDLIIMDEASQIKPQDALGALARGSQLVVVGDPKQLPPTSFFDRMVDDDAEDPTGIEESESILDATLPMFPARRLRWHYRSQHEALIAFSNHSFYDSDLVLFPSPHSETDQFGIRYVRVQRGCFVNRKNIEEAKQISEAVRDHFKNHPNETLGVVAMSAEQRQHIERAIETLAKDDPAFQASWERDTNRSESLFVKNLENVQGDERDVIFISLTYGPQELGGPVYQRFGPINSELGWRRLNVLFTRSRKRMHIFSSMGADDIVAGPSASRGVKSLQNFLRYCETGYIHQVEEDPERAPDSDFEVSVMDALRAQGFECKPQVGVSGFFIDVAVVDPGKPGRFLMGIECDGATYHSAKSARDRDRLRQAILERLGWRIRRIWSTDWFKNPHAELAPIVRELHQLKSEPTPVQVEAPREIKTVEAPRPVEEPAPTTVSSFSSSSESLREKLIRFNEEVIQHEFPDTPANKRVLRPAMLEALLEFTPTSKYEFLEAVPSYLRQATEGREGKFIDDIFEIINASLERA